MMVVFVRLVCRTMPGARIILFSQKLLFSWECMFAILTRKKHARSKKTCIWCLWARAKAPSTISNSPPVLSASKLCCKLVGKCKW